MKMEQISQYWDKRAKGYSTTVQKQLASEVSLFYRSMLLKCAPAGNALHCLDIGCGPGFFSILLAQAGHQVTAVDCSAEMLEKARENFSEMDVAISTVQADAQQLPFAADSFDYIVSRDLTWALKQPKDAYNQWVRLLKPGGKLLIVDSNHYLHYHDEDYAEAQKSVLDDPAERLYGVDPTAMDAFACELPLSRVRRPQWDVNTLLDLGMEHMELQVNRKSFLHSFDAAEKSIVEDFFVCGVKPATEKQNFMGTISLYQSNL